MIVGLTLICWVSYGSLREEVAPCALEVGFESLGVYMCLIQCYVQENARNQLIINSKFWWMVPDTPNLGS